MSALRTVIAAAALTAAGVFGAAGANAGVPLTTHVRPLCLPHYETDVIYGVGKIVYFIDSFCHKHYVRTVL